MNMFVSIGLFIVGSVMTYYGYGIYSDSQAVKNWPQTVGVITKLDIEDNNDGYDVKVNYQYSVKGTKYKGNRISVTKIGQNDETIYAFRNKYAVKNKVSVYYDDNNPSSAVLEIEDNMGTYFFLVFGGLLMFFSFVKTNSGGDHDFDTDFLD